MHRAELLSELLRAKRQNRLPGGVIRETLLRPSAIEDLIRFYRLIKSTDEIVLIDVGANTGYWSERFLKFFPKTKIYAFEPSSISFQQLERRFRDNPNVHTFHVALSNEKGVRTLHLAKDPTFSSFHPYIEHTEMAGSEDVQTERFDNVGIDLSDSHFRRVLKIDVQGFELQVLEGMANSLEHVDIALVELSFLPEYVEIPPSFSSVSRIFLEHGLYPAIFKDAGTHRGPYPPQRDVFFVRKQFFQNVKGW
jgi:FkbM family methyltransferase